MFRSIGRTILNLPTRVILLLAGVTIFVYADALHVVQNPFFIDPIHMTLVALATLCLTALFADGSAPTGTRRRAAFFVALVLLAVFLLIHFALGVAAVAFLVLGICAPACTARFGLRRIFFEMWRTIRRHYWRIGVGVAVGLLILVAAAALARPLIAYWQAIGFVGEPNNVELQAKFQTAWEICNQVGPRWIAQSGAAAAFLVGACLWSVGRFIAEMLAKETAVH